ncbi:uncharacterized protein LOC123557990 [Mercenaria mercenaria]|uniref:uncharacterized protein LOC123557990 n=1 Tax=Mercenaria mercenaria TaxID=6596 RepID=UPI00234F27EB|nr:uncharacterized protein LOC123557990 [Mercenaria mercenaria]
MKKHIAAHWTSSIDSNISSVWYEVGIVRNNSKNGMVSELERESGKIHVFQNMKLYPSVAYKFAVKLCTKQNCLSAVYSDIFYIEADQPIGNIEIAELDQSFNKTCFDIKMTWMNFTTESKILFYQWSISKDMEAAHIVTSWKTVQPIDENMIHECLYVQPHAYSHLFGCVKAYSLAGSRSMACTAFVVRNRWTAYKYVVYDLNSSADTWNFVLSMVHSSDISDTARSTLHDIDIDITPAEWTVAGAVMGTYGRNVTWYLMTSKHVPTHCSHNEECYYSTVTDTGYAEFPTNTIKTNELYYICAYSNDTLLHLEDYMVSLDEFSSCSNGFIKDNTPPMNPKMVVRVSNQNGYITDTSRLIIHWDVFADNINASVFGYPENIRAYSYAIGSSKGEDDIKQFSEVGHSTVVVAQDVNIRDGFPLYVTVKAFDYVGLEGVAFSTKFIVDTTPPVPGRILIEPEMSDINTVTFIDRADLFLHLTEYTDDESGLAYFEIGVGTHFFLNNIMSLTKYDTNAVHLKLGGSVFDGCTYFVNVKAVNNAGLSSTFVTGKIVIDRSAPTGGHVIDGDSSKQVDEDFINDIFNIGAQWRGFVEPHTGIHHYRCGFGTKPYVDDICSFIDVGLRENITWTGPFVSGQTYYTTVEACNHAGQCRSMSSDGVTQDNSPPIPGVVRIGSEDFHHKYYAHTNWLHVHWVGFEDPQSRIDHYEVFVGTSIGECNIMQKFNTGLKTNIIKTELHLPVKTNLYATVTAYNKIGMNVSYTSDSFQIDDRSPVVEQIPRFINPLTFDEEPVVQWEKSILKMSWLFKDQESPIINHRISLYTHHEGHTPVEYIYVGSQNNFTINLAHKEWLHNGDIYYVKVTSCNAASLCSASQSADLLIDTTPPHVGGFKQPLKWTNYKDALNGTDTNLTLTWYGFHDQESHIKSFYITVSRSYSGQELTGGTFTFNTENITNEYTCEVPLVENIFQDELLILSIWAENQAGLMSSVARISVYVLSETTNNDESLKHGALEIEKHSCDIHFCNNDCTCAVFGQPCIYFESSLICNEINSSVVNSLGYPTVDVRFGYTFEQNQTVTASSSCLSGTWKSVNSLHNAIERYEWSIGLAGQPIGEGIFDLRAEQPWNDVGIREEITHCLPVNRSLIHSESYILYIRAWYSHDEYATFTSRPIMIDQSAPAVTRGKFIKDSDVSCILDYDFIDWTQNITACWSGVFSEQQGSITHYTVALGTLPNADDVFPKTDVGLASDITLRKMSFTHGTKYFFTITAYNTAGLSTSLASDGFLVDTDDPIEGIVYNTIHMQNKEFQSSDSSISISWTGFTDHFSGIYRYQVAISDTDNKEAFENLIFAPVGLNTFHTFNNIDLEQNKTYYGVVKASDAAGHLSNVAASPGTTIDGTKPTGIKCNDFRYNQNGTFVFNGSGDSTAELMVNVSKNDLIRVSMRVDSADVHAKMIIGVGVETTYLGGLRLHNGQIEFKYKFFAQDSPETKITFRVASKEDSRLTVFVYRCKTFEADDQNAVSVTQTGLSVLNIDMSVFDKESNICSLRLGVGTTPEGFQVQSLTTFHQNINHAIVTANIDHGSPIHDWNC